MVHAEFKGTGTKKIMLIAHMDTVYERGILGSQPYRVDGERIYRIHTPVRRAPGGSVEGADLQHVAAAADLADARAP